MISSFTNFLFESSIALAVFSLIDWTLFQKGNQFKLRRYYLLSALLFSICLPFVHLNLNISQEINSVIETGTRPVLDIHMLEAVTVYASGVTEKFGQSIMNLQPIVLVYFLGSVIALIFIVTGFSQIFYNIVKYKRIKLKGLKLVISKDISSSYSFFNIIFINRALPREKYWKSIIIHELAHARQLHSFDILLLDLLMMVFWFNPFYWIVRKSIKENHEFLADAEVLNKGVISKGKYKALLLDQALGGKVLFTSNFKMKSTQKRFKMMSKLSNNKFNFLKITVAILVAIVISLSFSLDSKVMAQTQMKFNSSDVFVYKNRIIKKHDLDITKLTKPVIEVVPYSEFSEKYTHLKDQLKGDKVVLVFDLSVTEDAQQYAIFKHEGKPETRRIDKKIDDEVFVIVEEMPQFPGGEKGLRDFISKNVTYPPTAAKNGVQGKVYVQFIIEKDGSIGNAKVIRGVDPQLDKEALRIVKLLPSFKPGKQRGKLVRVSYTIPINFVLN